MEWWNDKDFWNGFWFCLGLMVAFVLYVGINAAVFFFIGPAVAIIFAVLQIAVLVGVMYSQDQKMKRKSQSKKEK